jgi:hypothetical protein
MTAETTGGFMLKGILGLMFRGILKKVLLVVYFIVGLIVANSHHYFAHINGIKPVASAVLAVALWPLILFGVRLHIK